MTSLSISPNVTAAPCVISVLVNPSLFLKYSSRQTSNSKLPIQLPMAIAPIRGEITSAPKEEVRIRMWSSATPWISEAFFFPVVWSPLLSPFFSSSTFWEQCLVESEPLASRGHFDVALPIRKVYQTFHMSPSWEFGTDPDCSITPRRPPRCKE